MPLTEADWNRAEPRESFVTLVYEVFESRAPEAYSAEELFDEMDTSRFGSDAEDVAGQFDLALELLVYEGKLEKRVRVDDGDETTFYRAR
ncbi:hypothetical protein [Halegenticoccus soli]|uniref:hypothetical protein n=1 Tax=Halegenticoccus soli TaxID=1985678 RepID=UPI000C6DE403|nr:hypothetical protein [Halegenticoccus soli]